MRETNLRPIRVGRNSANSAPATDGVPSPTQSDLQSGSNTPEAEQCRNLLAVTANMRRILRQYCQSSNLQDYDRQQAQSLITQTSQLIRGIRDSLINDTLEHPSVYRDRLNAINSAYMQLTPSQPS